MMSLSYIRHVNRLYSSDPYSRRDLWPWDLAEDGHGHEDPFYDNPGRDHWLFEDPILGSFSIHGPAGRDQFCLHGPRPGYYLDGSYDDIAGTITELQIIAADLAEDGPRPVDPSSAVFDQIYGGPAVQPATSGRTSGQRGS